MFLAGFFLDDARSVESGSRDRGARSCNCSASTVFGFSMIGFVTKLRISLHILISESFISGV